MLSKYKSQIDEQLQGLGRSLKWINPNVLTIIGIIPPVLFFYFLQSHNYIAAAIALILSCLDMLDGLVARASGKVTKFGGLLDSTFDRISDFLIIAAFYAAQLVRLEIIASLILISFLISYVRSRAELAAEAKIKFNQGLIERPERIIFLFVVVLAQAMFPDTVVYRLGLAEFLILILTFLSLITLVQRVAYAYRRL